MVKVKCYVIEGNDSINAAAVGWNKSKRSGHLVGDLAKSLEILTGEILFIVFTYCENLCLRRIYLVMKPVMGIKA